jgi:hypothetical protein
MNGATNVPAYSDGDGNGSGAVETEDRTVWRRSFGTMLGEESGGVGGGGEAAAEVRDTLHIGNVFAERPHGVQADELRSLPVAHVDVQSRDDALFEWLAANAASANDGADMVTSDFDVSERGSSVYEDGDYDESLDAVFAALVN